MTAHQEPNESKDGQEKGWHVSRLFVFILSQVNRLQADRIMAKHKLVESFFREDPEFARLAKEKIRLGFEECRG